MAHKPIKEVKDNDRIKRWQEKRRKATEQMRQIDNMIV